MGASLETIVLETVRDGVAMQMALNEAILRSSLPENNIVVRLIEFSKPGITLGLRQSARDVKTNSLPVTRRESAGSAMLCDGKQVYFAVFGPRAAPYAGPNEVHKIFGGRIAQILKKYGIGAEPSSQYYVKVDGKAIAGSAQHWAHKTWMYEGVLAMEPWDANYLWGLLCLRAGEEDWIADLPYVNPKKHSKQNVIVDLQLRLADDVHTITQIPRQVIEEAKRLEAEKYGHPTWCDNPDHRLKAGLGFCLCGNLGAD